jgi:hypothetical protein
MPHCFRWKRGVVRLLYSAFRLALFIFSVSSLWYINFPMYFKIKEDFYFQYYLCFVFAYILGTGGRLCKNIIAYCGCAYPLNSPATSDIRKSSNYMVEQTSSNIVTSCDDHKNESGFRSTSLESTCNPIFDEDAMKTSVNSSSPIGSI